MLIAADDFSLIALVLPRDGVVVAGNEPETPAPSSGKGEPVAAEVYITDGDGTRLLTVLQGGQHSLIPYELAMGASVRLHLVTRHASGVASVSKLADAPSVLVTAPSIGETVVDGGVEVQESAVTVIEG